jgi:hypothetical protein
LLIYPIEASYYYFYDSYDKLPLLIFVPIIAVYYKLSIIEVELQSYLDIIEELVYGFAGKCNY